MKIYDAFVAALPDPALLVDEDLVILSSNEAMDLLLEAKPSGQHLTAFFRAPAVLHAAEFTLNSGEKANVEFESRSPLPRKYDVFVSRLATEDMPHKTVLMIVRDLTYEQQIERMRADFVANASHELRTPLASLSGFIETMQGAAKQDDAARGKFLDLMKLQADRMTRLTDDLLLLSRIEINEHVKPTAKVELNGLLQQITNLLSTSARTAGCSLNLLIDSEISVIGDVEQLRQIFVNLMENAIKYGSAGKRIDITVHQHGATVEIAIRDYGMGIAAHHIPRLTERFYRVDVQESRTRGGTGLGLAIVKHIVNRHRGKLLVESELGKGSTFTVCLPIQ